MVKAMCYSGGKMVRCIVIEKPMHYEAEEGSFIVYDKEEGNAIFHWTGAYSIESDTFSKTSKSFPV